MTPEWGYFISLSSLITDFFPLGKGWGGGTLFGCETGTPDGGTPHILDALFVWSEYLRPTNRPSTSLNDRTGYLVSEGALLSKGIYAFLRIPPTDRSGVVILIEGGSQHQPIKMLLHSNCAFFELFDMVRLWVLLCVILCHSLDISFFGYSKYFPFFLLRLCNYRPAG